MHDLQKMNLIGPISNIVTTEEYTTFRIQTRRKVRGSDQIIELEVRAYEWVAKFAASLREWERVFIEWCLCEDRNITQKMYYVTAFDIVTMSPPRPKQNAAYQFHDLP